jgi:hypothetical protein
VKDSAAFLNRVETIKQERLLDILRRLIANPENAPQVAAALAVDWCPVVRVDSQGDIEVIL